MELTELVRGAQDAMNRGDYHVAAKACAHALDAYPHCLSAQRILGESLLEQGQSQLAVAQFERALAIDPLSVVARLGLGVASEEIKDTGLAYAHYLHAWEINPALDQVRSQLVRLRAALGSHDRLHPTRAGLAGIHARTGQFGRAAAEWRAILSVDPESARARTSPAEVLWRSGDDSSAAALCKVLLERTPENARALAMLAEIEKRQGTHGVAELVRRYQAIDPLGEVAALLTDYRPNTDLSFLTTHTLDVPDFDFEAVAAEKPSSAPVASTNASPLATTHVAAPDLWDNLVRDLQSDDLDPNAAIESPDLQPFNWSDDSSSLGLPASADPFTLDGLQDIETAPPVVAAPTPVAAAEPVAPVRQPSTPPPPIRAATPPPTPKTPPPAAAPVNDPYITADGRVDLTIGWDEIDSVLANATPTDSPISGYDDLLAELDAELGAGGAAPFLADESFGDDEAWEPFTEDELISEPVVAQEPEPAVLVPTPIEPIAEPFTADEVIAVDHAAFAWPDDDAVIADEADHDEWVTLDDDLISAIPSPQPSGYTELLRHVDRDELADLSDLALDVDPLFNPDSAGDPLDVESLLSVTSRDGTSELTAAEPPVVEPQPAIEATNTALPAFAWDDEAVASAFGVGKSVESPLAMDEQIGDAFGDLGEIEPFGFDDLLTNGVHDDPDLGVEFGDFAELFAPVSTETVVPAEAGLPTAHAAELPTPTFADVASTGWSAATANDDLLIATGDVDWPTYIGHTSDLIDREETGLFARLRVQKQLLESDGLIVDRSFARWAKPELVVANSQPVAVEAPRLNGFSPRLATVDGVSVDHQTVIKPTVDWTAMRMRLIESESAAAEIATTLETAIAGGATDPVTFRVLGEAYLRLGRTEQAAAQVRESMLARRRAR